MCELKKSKCEIIPEEDEDKQKTENRFYKAQKEIEPKILAVDGIHPTNLGHKIISDEILKHLTFK